MEHASLNDFNKIIGLLWFITVAIIIAIIATVVTYYWSVPDSASMRAELGQTGDYFGGILNPLFAFFSFIALLYTIGLQTKEMIASRNEAAASRIHAENSVATLNTQIDHMKKEAKRSDLLRMIEYVAKEINDARSKSIPICRETDSKATIEQVFGKEKDRFITDFFPAKDEDTFQERIEAVDEFADLITELAFYLDDYKQNNGDRSVLLYHSKRYGRYAIELHDKKYIGKTWKNILINCAQHELAQ